MRKVLLLVLVTMFFATACSKTDNSDMNYKTAINAHFKASPACIWSQAKKLPVQAATSDDAKTEGYDGGAVFSRDGKKIVWRANHPQTPEGLKSYRELLAANLTTPMKMELFIADADGKNQKQITDYGCASFAPTFTPDGKKILFSSNKHKCDSRDFELYLINPDGSGLEQVTTFGGFTSFPEFSPDGKKLVFAADYKATGKYEFNIFTADWK